MNTKKCTKCGEEKPLDQFHKQKQCKFGVRPDCKACFYAAHRARLDPVKHRGYNRTYRAKNPNKDREYYEKNKPRLIQRGIEYNRKNRETYLARMRKWRREHPEKVQIYVRKRRAKIKGSVGEHSFQDILVLKVAQKGRCVYCRADISKKHEVDHIIPIASGGSNDKSNLQLLCKPCNRDKSAKHPLDYARERGLLI